MDKYEYRLKTDHIKQIADKKEFTEAAKLCDTIDWNKVRDVKMLTKAADIYAAVARYQDAIDVLVQAYRYAPIGRRIIYRLTEYALEADRYEDAKEYFDEFCRIAPHDQGRFILLYRMACSQRATVPEKIKILEAYKREDFDEKWAYELALLYERNHQIDDCVQLCDDIILWFGLGKYVEKALTLKGRYASLTDEQKAKEREIRNMNSAKDSLNIRTAAAGENAKPQNAEDEIIVQTGINAADIRVDMELQELGKATGEAVRSIEEGNADSVPRFRQGAEIRITTVEESDTPEEKKTESRENENKFSSLLANSRKVAERQQQPKMKLSSRENLETEFDISHAKVEHGPVSGETIQEMMKDVPVPTQEKIPTKTSVFNKKQETAAWDKRYMGMTQEDIGTAELIAEEVIPETALYSENADDMFAAASIAEGPAETVSIAEGVDGTISVADDPAETVSAADGTDETVSIADGTDETVSENIESVDEILNEEELIGERYIQPEQEFIGDESEKEYAMEAEAIEMISMEEDFSEGTPVQYISDASKDTIDEKENSGSDASQEIAGAVTEEGNDTEEIAKAKEETSFEEAVEKEAAIEDAAKERAVSKEAAEKEAAINDAVKERAVSKEATEKEAAIKDTATESTVSKESRKEESAEKAAEEMIEDQTKSESVKKPNKKRKSDIFDAEDEDNTAKHEDEGKESAKIKNKSGKTAVKKMRAETLPITNPSDLSEVWHFALHVTEDDDPMELAMEYLDKIDEYSDRPIPERAARVTGNQLNSKDLLQSFDHMLGKVIVVLFAGEMENRVIDELCKVLEPTDRSLLMVLTDTSSGLKRLFEENPKLTSIFNAQFVTVRYTVSELLAFARQYADSQDCVFDQTGENALIERLEELLQDPEGDKKRMTKNIVDEAIEHAEKKSFRKAFKNLFSVRYDKEGRLILTEKNLDVE